MSMACYISLPRCIAKQQPITTYIKFKAEDDFIINLNADNKWVISMPVVENQIEGQICFGDKHNAVFDKYLLNPFVYEFDVRTPNYYYEQEIEVIQRHNEREAKGKGKDDNALIRDLSVYKSKTWSLRNQVLHKYLTDNLNPGEFAEIYTSWIEEEDENGMYFFLPTFEISISLNELLTLPYPKDWIDFGEREKITIHKIE